MTEELAKKSHLSLDGELTVEGGDVVAIVARDNVDDEGEVVVPKNFNLDRFRNVRQVYFDHDQQQHPIGSAKWIKSYENGRSLISKYFFSKATELGRAVGDLVKEGIYRCHSVGCLKSSRRLGDPTELELKSRPEWAGAKIWRGTPIMVEFSVVGQAANPECVALAVSKSWSKPTIDLLTGIAANTKRATEKIIEGAHDLQNKTRKGLTGGDLRLVIAKSLSEVSGRFNADAAIDAALQRLR